MEEKRNELGKVLACLLRCLKGRSTIKNLEDIYSTSEGRRIPYEQFGNITALDFLRSIPTHIKLVQEDGRYYVYPTVSEKSKHIQELVARQRSAKISSRRKSSRPTRYYPGARAPRAFVPHTVQKSVAHMLHTNPSGVHRSRVADCLQKSNAIAGKVDVDNVDDFIGGMPHTAVSSGSRVYPSRSLSARPRSAHRDIDNCDRFEIVTPKDSQTQKTPSGCNARPLGATLPAGFEDGKKFYIQEEDGDEFYVQEEDGDEFYVQKEDGEEFYVQEKYGENCYNGYDSRAQEPRRPSEQNRGRMTSAEFIDRAAEPGRTKTPPDVTRKSNNRGVERDFETVEEEKGVIGADCTYVSDEDSISVDIIGSRMKKRLQDLIEKHPDGIWCADLLQVYYDEYKVRFEYTDYGFPSICEFASNLRDIFQLERLDSRGDFKLYDARRPIPQSVSKPEPRVESGGWQDESEDEDVDAFPLKLERQESLKLIPVDVMAYGESVGQVRIPDVSEGPDYSNLEVYVSEVYTPSLFWIHLRKKKPKLEHLMESMHDFYQNEGHRYTIPTVVLEKGLNCVCTFQDKWHRAIIKTVKANGDVTVIFYDYGTTQTYPPESLRYLTRTYSNLPAQAIACGLYNIKPVNSDTWTRGASTEFYNRVEEIPLIAMVVKVDRENNSMLVSLVDTQEEVDFHINDWLVQQNLAEIGSLGDTVEMEFQYFEDQARPRVQVQEVDTSTANVPLILPHSTLPDNEVILRPPPGFTKLYEPTNYAAIMDENLQNRSYNTIENSNFCNVNYVNNNMLASANVLYNPLTLSPEALVQFWKQRMEMDIQLAAAMNQFLLNNNVASTVMNSTLNTTNMESQSQSVHSTPQQPKTNPFQLFQDERLSTTVNSLGESTNCFTNLNTSEFNTCNFSSSTTLPQTEINRNLMSKDSNPLDFDQKILREGTDAEVKALALRLHDTNPFKQHIIGETSSPVEINNNILRGPPVPPRNSNSINKDVNSTTKHIADVNPSPKMYYTSEPVMYNLETNNTEKTRGKEFLKSADSVSFGTHKHHDTVNLSQEITNHSSSENKLLGFGITDSSEVMSQVSFPPGLDRKILTAVRTGSAKNTQLLSPRIFPSNYRPPPPPYTSNSYTEYQYKNKSPISPRYPSPLVSDHSKVAIEDIQLKALDFYEKFEAAVMKTSGPKIQDDKLRNLGSFEKHTSSSSETNHVNSPLTTSESIHHSQNVTEPKKPYKIKLIIPKSLRGQQGSMNVIQEQQDNLHQTKVLNETSGITSQFVETQDFSKQEQNSSITNQDNQTLPWSLGNSDPHNPHGDVSKDLGKLPDYGNPFVQRIEETDTRKTEESSNPVPTLGNLQPLLKTDRDNSSISYNGEITDHLGFSTSTKPVHDSPISSTQAYQSQPSNMPHYYQPLYPQLGHLLPHRNYLYQIPPRPQFHQRMPLPRPNPYGYYPAPPPWVRPHLFNTAYTHAAARGSPPSPYPNFWCHNPMFAPKQAAGVSHRPAVPHAKHNSKVDFGPESISSETNHAQAVRLEAQNKQMDIDRSDFTQSTHELSSHSAFNGNITENATEKSGEEDSGFTLGSNGEQTLLVEESTSSSEESMIEILNGISKDIPNEITKICKPVEVNNQTIYLFNIDNEGWVCTDEIVQVFIPSETRNVVLRMLNVVNVRIDFKEISRAQSPDLFAQLDDTSLRLPRMSNSRRIRGTLHLTPLRSLSRMMIALRVISDKDIDRSALQKKPLPGSNLAELVKLVAAYRHNDAYWA